MKSKARSSRALAKCGDPARVGPGLRAKSPRAILRFIRATILHLGRWGATPSPAPQIMQNSCYRTDCTQTVPAARQGGFGMFSKINHVAVVSENYAQLAQFYIAAFGMRTSEKTRPGRAVTVGDGYVGLNINPRRAGRSAGLDHFGIQVEDCDTVFSRMRAKYPTVKWLKRPSNRPFAGITTHDPDGNVFDISQKDMANRTSVYVENDGKT